jgi:dihydropteroate synthase
VIPKDKFQRPLVFGVLNTTPDSFSDGGDYLETETAFAHAMLMVSQGANVIDIGGESTRPGALRVPIEIEQQRVIPVIEKLASSEAFRASNARLSIDTMNAETAKLAIAAGATIVNDVSGGLADEAMFEMLLSNKATYVLSHWRGFSDTMDSLSNYESVARDVRIELATRVDKALSVGIERSRLVIDPGLGFAKDVAQNWHLVARLDELEKLDLPILVGASRKRFIASALDSSDPAGVSNSRRDLATAVLTALLLQRKIWGIRVHNVQTSVDAIKVVEAFANQDLKGQA